MSSYEATFEWPHSGPSSVIVTGTFDEWSSSVSLAKTENGTFKGKANIPWGEKIQYKFVVDGQWLTEDAQSTETDSSGNVNNVFTAPSKPSSQEDAIPTANGKPNTTASGTTPLQLVSDLVQTIAARDGTSSTLEYVTSGIGAAIQSTIGVDPFSSDKIAIPTPKDGSFTLPEVPSAAAASQEPIKEEPAKEEASASTEQANGATPEAPKAPEEEGPSATEPEKPAPQEEAAPISKDVPPEVVPAPAVVNDASNVTTTTTTDAAAAQSTDPAKDTATTDTPEPSTHTVANGAAQLKESKEPEATPAPTAVAPESKPEPAKEEVVPEPIKEQPPSSEQKEVKEAAPEVQPVKEAPTKEATPAPETKAEDAKPATDGFTPKEAEAAANVKPTTPPATTPEPPSTPKEKFPSSTSASESPSSSPASSKYGTVGSRKKRTSIFGSIGRVKSIKNIFSHDKEKSEKK